MFISRTGYNWNNLLLPTWWAYTMVTLEVGRLKTRILRYWYRYHYFSIRILRCCLMVSRTGCIVSCTKPHVNSAYQHVIALTTKISNMPRLFRLVFPPYKCFFFLRKSEYSAFLGFVAQKSGRLAGSGMLLRG